MPTTIRTDEPRELLSLIPYQLGFEPRRSAVLVSLRGARKRVGLVLRADLEDLTDPRHGGAVARSLVTHLDEDGATAVVLVVYPDRPRAEAADEVRTVHERVVEAAHPVGDVDCWVVGPGGYYAALCADLTCCPGEGRPLRDLASTQVGAEMVLSGAAVLPTRDDLGRVDPAPPAARRSARRAAARWARRGQAAVEPAELHAWRREGLALWRATVATCARQPVRPGPARVPGPPLTPVVAGRLQAFLADVRCRDAVIVGLVPSGERVADRVVVGDDRGVGAALGAIMDPHDGLPPDALLVAATTRALEHVVAHSARSARAPALTLLGLLAWWQGDGARAGVLVERALVAEPGHRLAHLVTDTLTAGMPPGWLRAR